MIHKFSTTVGSLDGVTKMIVVNGIGRAFKHIIGFPEK